MWGFCRGFAWVTKRSCTLLLPPAGSGTQVDVGVTCCVPLGLPGCCEAAETLLLLAAAEGFSAQGRAGLQHVSRSALLSGEHIARGAQKRGCKASLNPAVRPKPAQSGIIW